ncbi:uncharacterized protein HD556DRAFT_1314686 [Suillus plorans]|uniref:Ion transport domain-containing protein n=1 Tax=Suillus plorans TaxID=116603 RepID=A0A9P7A9G8_9AGAM|nr:uncharacterized protein HD556DRAFT_1314686 [Suillus plorans]KAG1784884.1 hypothetical protein HD556DRAFT_1314686 [Suillus plorans]
MGPWSAGPYHTGYYAYTQKSAFGAAPLGLVVEVGQTGNTFLRATHSRNSTPICAGAGCFWLSCRSWYKPPPGDFGVPENETAHGESSHHLNILQTTKPSQLTVFGNLYGLVNMTIFLLVVNLLAVLVCVELIRGDMNDSIGLNFGQLWNSFLAMYQLFSSENWTNILYSTAITGISLGQVVIVIIFLCSWLIFANFIMMQMFVAVIHENFSVAEETKKSGSVRVKVEIFPSNLVLPMQKTLVQDYGVVRQHNRNGASHCELTAVQNEETGRYLDILAKVGNGNDTTENDHDEHSEWKAQKAGPSRNVSNIAARDYEDLSQCRIPVYACTNKIKIVRGIVKQQHHELHSRVVHSNSVRRHTSSIILPPPAGRRRSGGLKTAISSAMRSQRSDDFASLEHPMLNLSYQSHHVEESTNEAGGADIPDADAPVPRWGKKAA